MRDRTTPRSTREISDLTDNTTTLMTRLIGGHLTVEQLKQTLHAFPDIDEAVAVANAYFSIPKKERYEAYSGYLSFLELVEETCFKVETQHEQEVAERTARIPQESLMQESYRDKPHRSSHFYEHLATRMTG